LSEPIQTPDLMLQRKAAVAVWRQIETDIAVDIEMGALGPGDRLPTEQELVTRYNVNRHTIRMALSKLSERGLLVTQQGRGVFVAEESVEYLLNRNAKWSEIEKRFEAEPDGKLIDHYTRPATARLARILKIDEGEQLCVTESIRRASRGISTYGYHTFADKRFHGIEAEFRRSGSFTKALARYGVPQFFRVSTWIDCRIPRPREAKWLDTPIETPVLIMTYVDCDENGDPILFGHAVLPQGAMRIRIDSASEI